MIIILLLAIAIILIIAEIKSSQNSKSIQHLNTNFNKSNTPPPTSSTNNTEAIKYKDFYTPKRYLITLTELNFYKILHEVAQELELVVFSQVSLYNIVEVKNTPYKNTAFNKIRAKSIDFVLTDIKSCRIQLCIELDDYTHKRPDRIERDKFLEELFSSLEINFISIKPSNYYHKEALKNRIVESIKQHYYA